MDLDRVYGGTPRFLQEQQWSKRLALRLLREVPARMETVLFGRVPTVANARGSSEIVFVCVDAEALVPPIAQRRLAEWLLERNLDLVLPVSNESPDPVLKSAPDSSYVTPSGLLEIAALFAANCARPELLSQANFPVFAIRRSLLGRFPPDLPLEALPRAAAGARMAVDRGAYVHRYGALEASERSDLVERIPEGARAVLDVGCAQGASAQRLRDRGVAEIVGIEPEIEDARVAASRYDRVVCCRLDAVSGEPWEGRFDAILFGDVLEHLDDPGLALEQVRPWLSSRGRVVASVPNVGHAAILADLLEGRFDYIPYSILSGTHVRFFTRRSLTELFESCGYAPDHIAEVKPDPTPRVRQWTERLAPLSEGNADLAVTEFLIVARSAAQQVR